MAWESQYFSLNKDRDWQRCPMHNLSVGNGQLTLSRTATYAVEKRLDLTKSLPTRVVHGTAALATRLYLLTETADVWIFDPFTGYTEPVFPLGQRLFSPAAQLVALSNLLVIADPDRGVTAYSAVNRQPIWDFQLHHNVRIQPLAIASDHEKYVFVLGRKWNGVDGTSSTLVLVKLSDNGRVVATRDVGDSERMATAAAGDVRMAAGHGRICVLFRSAGERLVLAADDLAPVAGARDTGGQGAVLVDVFLNPVGQEQVVAVGENGAFLFVPAQQSAAVTAAASSHPALDGVVDQAFTDGADTLLSLDVSGQRLVVSRYRPSYVRNPQSGRFEGVLLTGSFDSLEAGTRWHKVVFDADVPPECQIVIRYRASDSQQVVLGDSVAELDALTSADLADNPNLNAALEASFSEQVVSAPDALIEAQGRYLWLLVRVVGGRSASPSLQRLRVHYPRASYVDFLPAVYQEDPSSKDFLERFLAILQTLSSNLDERIDKVSQFFDADIAPPDMIRWLPTWLGFTPDETWEDDQLRDLIRALPELNRLRGTRRGIEWMIQLYTGQIPLIVEYPQYESLMSRVEFRELMSGLYGGNPNSFAVLVNGDAAPDARRRYVLSKLIERQKPAFTEAKLVILSPWIYMDMHAYLGINTYLSEAKSFHLDGKSVLPHDTTIIDVGAWITNYGGIE